jgi:polysaccharide export outer membrane protein
MVLPCEDALAQGRVDPTSSANPAGTVPSKVDASEYRLNYGDVLEFSVRGFPDLRQKAMVELDGEVSLPLAGRVRVIGMPLSAAQEVIKALATPRPLQQRSPDGREIYVALALDDVLVTIAEYRPIYVLGDIGKPGELPYRPGMTVRQAIALGGGFDIMRYRLVNPFTESADLKGQHEVLWTDAARIRVRLKRIEVELEGKAQLDQDVVADIPLEPAYLEEIVRTEAETLNRRLADYTKEVAHIRGLIDQNVSKVENLKKQLASEVQGMNADTQEMEQVKDFQKRGALPLMRIMEIRRIQLTNSTRVLQTRVQFDQAERDLAEAKRSLERLYNTYRTALLADRQEQLALYNSLLARISANSEKLEHTSILKSRLVRGRGAKVKISIHRSLLDFKQTLVGSEDTALFPGDTVEISLENERDADETLRRIKANAISPRAPVAATRSEPDRPPSTGETAGASKTGQAQGGRR